MSRGFGFLTFPDAMSVEKVLQVSHHVLDGRKIDTNHAAPRNAAKKTGGGGSGGGGGGGWGGINCYPGGAASTVTAAANWTLKTKKIFVGGLTQKTTVEEIKQYFTQFGGVRFCLLA